MAAVVSGLVVLVVVAFTVLASPARFEGTWGMGEMGGQPPARPEQEGIPALCARAARLYDLTCREEEVLLMRLQGSSLEEVRQTLCVSPNTVKTHVRHIYGKLGVANLEEARQAVESSSR